MALTSKIIKSASGMEIDILNNGIMALQSIYSSTMKLMSMIKYNAVGVVTEIDNYIYDSAGIRILEHRASSTGITLDDINYNYTNGKLSTMTHHNSLGVLTETDYINTTTGLLSSIVFAPKTIGAVEKVVLLTPPSPVVSSIATQLSSDATPVWSNVSGAGGIDMIKALSLVGTTISDVSTTQKWGIIATHFDDSIAAGYIGKGVVIADIDTGIDLNNKALTGNLSQYNWNFITNNANVQDDNGHGSFTASEMVASDNGNGIVGASNGSQLMVLKAMDAGGSGTAINVANAINYAVDHGANVINMSLNGLLHMPDIDAALTYASQHNVLVSIAAGNIGGIGPEAPADNALTLPNIVAVGSIANLATGYCFSNSSNSAGCDKVYNFVDAPGVGISGYNSTGGIIAQSGTSMSSAYVASAMADLYSAYAQTHSAANAATIDLSVISALTHGTDTIGLVGVSAAVLAAH